MARQTWVYSMDEWPQQRNKRRNKVLPGDTFDLPGWSSWKTLKAVVPTIPPDLRPKAKLSNYWILWEADWEEVPTDPMLLRHLGGSMYAVMAQWDLTEVERAVLFDSL